MPLMRKIAIGLVATALLLLQPCACGAAAASAGTAARKYSRDWDGVAASVVLNGQGRMELVAAVPHRTAGALAHAAFNDTIPQIGWAQLAVMSDPSAANDTAAARAAGFAEGALTAHRIYQQAVNVRAQSTTPQLSAFIRQNVQWMQAMQQIAEQEDSGSADRTYWWQVRLVWEQLNGIYEGYLHTAAPGEDSLTLEAIILLNLSGDIEDLGAALSPYFLSRMRLGDYGSYVGGTHCSALIKLTDNNQDLFVSHNTWSTFESMLRIYKMYDLAYSQAGNGTDAVAARRVSFSSYPGILASIDDFYVLSSGLVVQETTIGNSNPDLYRQFVSPMTVMEWMRNVIANRLARSGSEWSMVYRKYNSGTYNNQNMVVDFKLFAPGQPIQNNTLWVVEQLPGYVVAYDRSDMLRTDGYYASYNVPIDATIRQLSGVDILEQTYGDWFSYSNTPRARIFRQRQGGVRDLEGMQSLMRYNDFKNDPLSTQLETCQHLGWHNCTPSYTAENAIACRSDLNPKDGVYSFGAFGHRDHAAIDAKIAAFSQWSASGVPARIISGPTYDQQPPFSWSTSDFNSTVSHIGHPDVFKFPWVSMDFSNF